MLINFDNPQSPVIILIENGLDAGGFSGSRISEEEAVVGWFSCQEGLCIFNELFLWNCVPEGRLCEAPAFPHRSPCKRQPCVPEILPV